MKQLTLVIGLLLGIYQPMAQPQKEPALYPLKLYLNKNHPVYTFSFYTQNGSRIPVRIQGTVDVDSVTFLLPKGNILMRCSFLGKQLDLGIVKRPMPDTIRFHN
ncbi:hypothetical protein [Phnomibacter sp. MR]|uniref:hypothetical protein n=1 Tax=Phnomibacter sp. MR TaxID=3042318 RepID=UPI003A80BCCD